MRAYVLSGPSLWVLVCVQVCVCACTFPQASVFFPLALVVLAKELEHVLQSGGDGFTGVPGTPPEPKHPSKTVRDRKSVV